MQAIETVLAAVERLATRVGATLLVAIMAIVSVDVTMRYGLRSPLDWAHDFVALYAMAGVFFLALSPAYRERAHIGVDVLVSRLGPRLRSLGALLGDLAGLALFVPILWVGLQRTITSFSHGDVLEGLIPWPTWLSNGFVPLGCALLVLRLLVNAVGNARRLRAGEAPPAAGDAGRSAAE